MNVIATNGQEITLGCLVNLHEKTVYTYNGIFAKISKYYDAISHGLWKIMHFNDLRLLFYSFSLQGFTQCKYMDIKTLYY